MSFDLKNIEQENLDFKKLAPITLALILFVIASIIFVYYWFTFEKDKIIQDQYLGQDSEIRKEQEAKELEDFSTLPILESSKAIEESYDREQ